MKLIKDIESYIIGFRNELGIKDNHEYTLFGHQIDEIIKTMRDKYVYQTQTELENNLMKWYGQDKKPELIVNTTQKEINEAVWSYLWTVDRRYGAVSPAAIVDALDKAGLRIVRK